LRGHEVIRVPSTGRGRHKTDAPGLSEVRQSYSIAWRCSLTTTSRKFIANDEEAASSDEPSQTAYRASRASPGRQMFQRLSPIIIVRTHQNVGRDLTLVREL